ncbi:MAG: hypothetical protein HYT93_04970 [Parcubacteria group bacterium]|nr:hypothetical protein [Parcubacteria group bacterium]
MEKKPVIKKVPVLLFTAVLVLFAIALFKDELATLFADDNSSSAQPIKIACPGSTLVVANPEAQVKIPNRCDFIETFRTHEEKDRVRFQTFPDGEVYGPGARPRPEQFPNPVESIRYKTPYGEPIPITIHFSPAKKTQ